MRSSSGLINSIILSLLVCSILGCGTAPKIISQPPENAKVGQEYKYKIEAEGSLPMEFQIIKGPGKETFENKTGHLYWVPQSAGDAKLLIGVRNRYGEDQQEIVVHVEEIEKLEFKEYVDGFERGKEIWDDPYSTYGLVEDIVRDKIAYSSDPRFREGLVDGYLEGAKEKSEDKSQKEAARSIDLILSAGASKSDFDAGYNVGSGLLINTITVEEASREQRQSTQGTGGRELAWKSGFVLGYSKNGVTRHQAVRIYLALPH